MFSGEHATLDGYEFSGKVDPQIILELILPTGRSREEILSLIDTMRSNYVQRLEAGMHREGMTLLPGVRTLLEHLSRRDDMLVGLLTGNWRGGAEIKLSRFGLAKYFRFGAFGDDVLERRPLAGIALRRAAEILGCNISPQNTLIIGDSLRDVDCAQAAGLRSLAVATGFTSLEKLRAAGPDWAVADLDPSDARSPLPDESTCRFHCGRFHCGVLMTPRKSRCLFRERLH